MKKILTFLFATFSLFAIISCKSSGSGSSAIRRSGAGDDVTVVIDLANKSPINDGVFEGWGTSLCWWANRVGGNEKLSNELVDLFFTMDKGIGLNIVRYNIGGGDDPSHNHITRSDSAMPGFWKNVDADGNFDYDWTADERQRNVLRKIASKVDENELIIEFFSNSPPYFMTKSGCAGGSNRGWTNNIRDDMYDDFADYLAEVTYQLQKIEGIKVASLEPMNEPGGDQWKAFNAKQEGCHITRGGNHSKLLIKTREALDKRNLKDIIVSGCDEQGAKTQAKSFKRLSSKAKSIVGRINTHTYKNIDYDGLLELAEKYGKSLWVSETDGEYSIGIEGQMGSALYFAEKIIQDMNNHKPSAWLIWQATAGYMDDKPFNGITDGYYGIPNFEGGIWGTAITDFVNEKVCLSKKYYAFGQFTKYIRPGDYVIYTRLDDYIASYNPDAKQISIISVNPDDEEKDVTFDLSSFAKSWKKIRVVRTSGASLEEGDNLSEINVPIDTLDGGLFKGNLTPYSVTTFILEGVELR